jgi:predicted RNase H-like HicB family nuclease
MQVIALIHHENGRYGVSFPDFPGATTVARDLDGAIVKAAEVLAFHVEGLAEDGPLPQPRNLEELRRDRAFAHDMADAIVAAIPYNPPASAVRINITMDESLLVRIDRAAEAAGETRSGFLAAAAKARLAAPLAGAGNQGFGEKETKFVSGRTAVAMRDSETGRYNLGPGKRTRKQTAIVRRKKRRTEDRR